ncbi:membrane protein [Methanosarcina sp. 1.H.T.1A.1]|nr:membrane protein [Methanosarcina sp. 1.H.T.1A.1]
MSGKVDSGAIEAKQKYLKLSSSYFRKGLGIAVLSGMFYGLYTAFITLAMSKGVWGDWYGENTALLSAFVITYMLAALGAAVNDICSALWATGIAAFKGKMGDFFRSINTKPGHIMIFAALVGGPIATTAYVAGLQLAGSIIIPISALCPSIGAILSRILFKQALSARMMLGIGICFAASFLIGWTSVVGGEAPERMLLGIAIAFIAAFGWGLEGCIAGYGTSMIDYEIGITIRQATSGLANLLILVPLFALVAGNIGLASSLTVQAFTSGPAMIWFLVSGFCALFAFSLWYKGNSMCGTALGMAANGTYSFWGPFFAWIILGIIFGLEGWGMSPVAWVAAIMMAFGILVIAMNPLDLFRKKERIS